MDKLLDILKSVGFPYAYDHFADGKVYYRISEVRVELYTDQKDLASERKPEDTLDDCGIFYEKSETWIDSEKLYEVLHVFAMPSGEESEGRTDKEMEGAGDVCEKE